MASAEKALAYAQQNRARYLEEYQDFLRIPSVSTLSEHKADMEKCAAWVAGQLSSMGFNKVAVMPTAKHPVVYGEWLGAPGQPTVLVYGHYDVQPVDPLNEWAAGPFEPTLRADDYIYARGASDMKGQVHAFLKALEALLKHGELGVNVKMMIEGEEEIGSPSLRAFMDANQDLLKCDVVLNADSGIIEKNLPSIIYGLRGLAYFELWVHGPDHDLHSGTFGGTVLNPAQALCELVAGMHDAAGRITLPGYYDKVRTLSEEERTELARLPHTDEGWRAMTGAPGLYGENGYTTIERAGARPTLEINGLYSGFIGEGSKTVLPAKAMAKISMRLVPYQDDAEVEQQLRAYLEAKAPKTVRWELKSLAGGPAAIIPRETVAVKAAASALEATFGVKPVFELAGGSVPVVVLLKQILNVDSIMLGFGLRDDNIHSPNEKQYLPNYYRGIETYIRFFANMAG
ncbi:MAG: dipeptidase [Anaerolineales bacterium]|nr:dipeptidase [Anaerolineales bacterium]